MRRMVLAFAVSAMLVSGAMAKTDDLGITTTVTTGLYGSYYFRGAKLATNGIATDATVLDNITPRLTAKGYFWNYVRTGGGPGVANNVAAVENDYDVSLSWTAPWAKDLMTFTAGHVYYDELLAAVGPDTAELYGALTFNVPWSPSVSAYYQYKKLTRAPAGTRAIGTYIKLSAGNSWALGKNGWSGSVSGWVGFDTNRLRKGGFQDANIRTALSYELSPGLSVSPAIDWVMPGVRVKKLSTGFVVPVPSVTFAWSKSF